VKPGAALTRQQAIQTAAIQPTTAAWDKTLAATQSVLAIQLSSAAQAWHGMKQLKLVT
jgi:hypothetical protein